MATVVSYLQATLVVDGESRKFDLGLNTDIIELTGDQIMQVGEIMGKAYGKLLIMAKEGKLPGDKEVEMIQI